MSAKIGTIRTERNRAIKGQKDMRKTNRELVKNITMLRATLQQIQVMAENGDYGIAALAKEALCSTQ